MSTPTPTPCPETRYELGEDLIAFLADPESKALTVEELDDYGGKPAYKFDSCLELSIETETDYANFTGVYDAERRLVYVECLDVSGFPLTRKGWKKEAKREMSRLLDDRGISVDYSGL